MLVRCILCSAPVRRGVEIIQHDTGREGTACWACLRRSRRTCDTSAK